MTSLSADALRTLKTILRSGDVPKALKFLSLTRPLFALESKQAARYRAGVERVYRKTQLHVEEK